MCGFTIVKFSEFKTSKQLIDFLLSEFNLEGWLVCPPTYFEIDFEGKLELDKKYRDLIDLTRNDPYSHIKKITRVRNFLISNIDSFIDIIIEHFYLCSLSNKQIRKIIKSKTIYKKELGGVLLEEYYFYFEKEFIEVIELVYNLILSKISLFRFKFLSLLIFKIQIYFKSLKCHLRNPYEIRLQKFQLK